MKVIIVEPMKQPYEKEIGELKEMREIVGGNIQAVFPYPENVALICNEEGKLLPLPQNTYIPELRDIIFGTFLICGCGVEDFCSLSEEQVKRYINLFKIR